MRIRPLFLLLTFLTTVPAFASITGTRRTPNAVTDPNGECTLEAVETGDQTFAFSRQGYLTENRTITSPATKLASTCSCRRASS